jgi:hypothetical protein
VPRTDAWVCMRCCSSFLMESHVEGLGSPPGRTPNPTNARPSPLVVAVRLVTEINRRRLVLFGMHNWTLGPRLAAIDRLLFHCLAMLRCIRYFEGPRAHVCGDHGHAGAALGAAPWRAVPPVPPRRQHAAAGSPVTPVACDLQPCAVCASICLYSMSPHVGAWERRCVRFLHMRALMA